MRLQFYMALLPLMITNCMGRAQKGVDPCQSTSVKTFPEGDAATAATLQDLTVESTATCAQLVKNNIDTCETWFVNSQKRDNVLISCADASSKAIVCEGKCTENNFGSHDTCEGGRKKVAIAGGTGTPANGNTPDDGTGAPPAEETTPTPGDDDEPVADDPIDDQPEVPATDQPVQIGDLVPTGMVVDDFPQEIACLADQAQLESVCLTSVDPSFTGDNIIVDCQRKKAISCEGRCMIDPDDASASLCERGLKLRTAAVVAPNPLDDDDQEDITGGVGGQTNGTPFPSTSTPAATVPARSSGCD